MHYGAPRNTPDLEGFLFPSTYQLREPISIPALVADQLNTFKQQFARVDLGAARSRHLTPYDVLIIASMIEDEARHRARLPAGRVGHLQPAEVPHAAAEWTPPRRYEFNDWTHSLTNSRAGLALAVQHPAQCGLPPTPIDNPGMAAIKAAAHPARTNYLYFVVEPCGNGSSVFASNYQQFLRDSARYQSARARARRLAGALLRQVRCRRSPASASSAGRSPTAARRRCRTPRCAAVGLHDWRYQLLPGPAGAVRGNGQGAAGRPGSAAPT